MMTSAQLDRLVITLSRDVVLRSRLLRGLDAHPEIVAISRCARCKSICLLHVIDCECCKMYGTRKAGGDRLYYPDDGKRHERIATADDFRSRLERAA